MTLFIAIRTIGRSLLWYLVLFLIATAQWVQRMFGEVSFDQVLYHLQHDPKALTEADPAIVQSFVKNVVGAAALVWVLVGAVWLVWVLHRQNWLQTHVYPRAQRAAQVGWFALTRVANVIRRYKMTVLALVAVAYLAQALGMVGYAQSQFYAGFVDRAYVKPQFKAQGPADGLGVVVPPAQKRNLIVVYVESLESTYRNPQLFRRNLVQGLDKATEQWHEFSHFEQAPGAHWTIAGIVASQCGIPLRPYSWVVNSQTGKQRVDGNEYGQIVDDYLPNAVCLGDILKQAGYTNVFLNGVYLEFAGVEKYFRQHGYDKVMGRVEYAAQGEKMFGWGVPDDRLLELAFEEVQALAKQEQPFNLTVLTIDNHGPQGTLNPTCKSRGVVDFTGILECNANLVGEFIDKLKQGGYLNNTDVVVMGDHAAYSNTLDGPLKQSPQRSVYNRFYSSAPITKNRDHIYHYSFYPSILEMLGFEVGGGRVGIGFSGFHSASTATSPLYTEPNMDVKLTATADIYKWLWGEGR